MDDRKETQLVTNSDCYRAGKTIRPTGIMVHSTGVAQPDPRVFIKSWNQPGKDACVHAVGSRDKVIQTLPWTMRGWHAGKGEKGSANNTHISFECCEPAGHTYQGGTMIGYDVEKNEAYFRAIYQNAVALCADLCRQFGLDPMKPGVVICHAEGSKLGIASNHADVLHWWPKHGVTMDDFRAAVKAAMEEEEESVTQQQFNAMMAEYLKQAGNAAPASWSQQARTWAEKAGIIAGGEGKGERYGSFATREEIVQMLWRLSQQK